MVSYKDDIVSLQMYFFCQLYAADALKELRPV